MIHVLQCKDCKHIFEHTQSIRTAGEGNWPPCPECGGECRKVYQPLEIRYVGPGWQQTRRINRETEPIDGAYEPIN